MDNMKAGIIYVRSLNENNDINTFFEELDKSRNIYKNFTYSKRDETFIREILRDYITKNGISSLFNYSITCDALMHKGIHVNEIEKVILGFIKNLNGVKNLIITDTYFYEASTHPFCIDILKKIISEISKELESITFMTLEKSKDKKKIIHDAIKSVIPKIKIIDIISNDFHDRFWIDIDNLKGVIIGTSLNGIGKRIALIDNLSTNHVKEIIDLIYLIKNKKNKQ
ncbi:hypothetical protein [Janthinobacterium sp. B9-8]|uniref:hypothetical protein n=1 Tax=Janthinobacterium sp. B9-8 TaxID=1236179 RepID=UPI00061CE149|nr:hypothetical protein [Janthinobacterium sp. B9-8]AMC35310.1 hypothetical protein VN23_12170 [Janthinobacterium sp. B9-8]